MEFDFKMEKVPHLALAQLLVGIVNGEVGIDAQQRRVLIDRFSEILSEVTSATAEVYLKGFEDGIKKSVDGASGSE